jgi:GNAT superfamily N-acetyltransferase
VAKMFYVEPRANARKKASCPRVAIRAVDSLNAFDVRAYDPGRAGGGSIGRAMASYNAGALVVTSVFMNDDWHGCGVGTRLYEVMAQHACEQGLALHSDTTLSDFSKSFWRKQERKGRARFNQETGRYELTKCAADLSGAKRPRRRGGR